MSEVEPAGLDDVTALERLSEAVVTTSERIADVVAAHPEYAGMGTTLTALAWLGGDPPRVAVLHVGDSRAYLLRAGALSQVTRDHTYVQTLIDAGRITAEEATVHPRRNLLMRAIDGVHPAEPDLSVREAHPGDRFLVCSDGLSGYVAEDRLAELLATPDPTAAVIALVEAALEAGAPDNVTCVVADVVEVDEAPQAQTGVVVGAAGEPRNRDQLPDFAFPLDAQPDPRSAATVVRVSTRSSMGDGTLGGLAGVYHEESPARVNRRRGLRALAVLAAVLLVVGGAAAATYTWAMRQYYVGADGGFVTIFRGVAGGLGPVALSQVESVSDVTVDSLPDFEAMQVESTIATDSLAEAQQVVQRLSERAEQCVAVPTTPGCPSAGQDLPLPGATPTTTATASPSPSATVTG